MTELDPTDLHLETIVKSGDRVMWGQAAAEPAVLTAALMASRHAIGPFFAFVGISLSDAVQAAHADVVSFTSYGGGGNNRQLAKAGALDVLPWHYSQLGRRIRDGEFRVDVLLLQLAPTDSEGRYSMSLACEYLVPAIDKARVVIAEINELAPASCGPHSLCAEDIDFAVHTCRLPLAPAAAVPSAKDLEVAAQVAMLLKDGSTVQYGIGALPEAIVAKLSGHRDLGLHSGTLGDAAAALIRSGVVTNARKPVDTGISITGMLMGGSAINGLAHGNRSIELRSVEYTHSAKVLASLDRFVSINAAIEVDLTGQVNAEVAAGVYVGAVGGGLDFIRGAQNAERGMPIIALPSRVEGKNLSRIVAHLGGAVTTPRSDGVVIVTEHGAADLRGLSLLQRVQKMIGIAHPEHRDGLRYVARQLGLH